MAIRLEISTFCQKFTQQMEELMRRQRELEPPRGTIIDGCRQLISAIDRLEYTTASTTEGLDPEEVLRFTYIRGQVIDALIELLDLESD